MIKNLQTKGFSTELSTVKPFFRGGSFFFCAFAKISIRAELIFALSHCRQFFPLSLVSQNAL